MATGLQISDRAFANLQALGEVRVMGPHGSILVLMTAAARDKLSQSNDDSTE